MSTNPEEHLLDQSLREAFHDYLPPTGHLHVWDGIEERIASLPAQRTGSLAYRLVLPLTAALGVGVAVGWLLPRPASPVVAPAATPTVHATTWMVPYPATTWTKPGSPQPVTAAVALVIRPAPATEIVPQATSSHAPRLAPRAGRTNRPAAATTTQLQSSRTATARPDSNASQEVATVASARQTAQLASEPDSMSIPAVAFSSPTASAENTKAATPERAAVQPVKALKQEEMSERMLYRKPTHRQPERGLGPRRWIAHLTHLLHRLI